MLELLTEGARGHRLEELAAKNQRRPEKEVARQ